MLRSALPALGSRRRASAAAAARPAVEALESRVVPYAVSGNAWPSPQLVTISFEPDGTNLGGVSSNLFATFNAKWATTTWQNVILKAAQAWAQQTKLNFAVVADSGAPLGSGSYVQGDPTVGDIRIGGYNFGSNSLAASYQPPPVNNYSIAGDIQFNTGQVFNIGTTYDLFTVALHEFGHALGLYHSAYSTAVMYPAYTGAKSGLSADDISGIRAIYGNPTPDAYDAAASNGSFQTASDISTQINAASGTAQVSGLEITSTADLDFYRFTVPAGVGGSLTVRVQSQGLSLLAPTLTVYNAAQSQLATVSGAGQYGTTLTASVANVSPGQTYYVKVAGADTSAFGTGAYGLSLGFGGAAAPSQSTSTSPMLASSLPTSGGGQANKIGEYQVNTTTAHEQQNPVMAMAPDGRSVVVWASNGQDGGGWGVYAQRYSATGVPQGAEFRANTTTASDQTSPSVGMAGDGSFVVAWQSNNQDGSGWGVYAQRFDASGNPLGGEFRVNTTTGDNQQSPSVAMAADGSFVIAWQSNKQDGGGWGVYAQRFDPSGSRIGGEFQANTATANDQTSPAVGMAADDSFVIAWASNGQDGGGWGIYAQRFSSAGVPLGGEFQVNTTTASDQTNPTVALAADGSFAVAWQSNNQDGDNWGVIAQRYGPLGQLNLVESKAAGTVGSLHGGPHGPGCCCPFCGGALRALGVTAATPTDKAAPPNMPLTQATPDEPAILAGLVSGARGTERLWLEQDGLILPAPAVSAGSSLSSLGGGMAVNLLADAHGDSHYDTTFSPPLQSDVLDTLLDGVQHGGLSATPVSEDAGSQALTATGPAVGRWQEAWDACFAGSAVLPASEEDLAPDSRAAPQLADASVTSGIALAALLGGFRQTWETRTARNQGRRPGQAEQRRSLRYPCYLRAKCRPFGTPPDQDRAGVARDVSAGGANLILEQPFLPGTLLLLELGAAGDCSARLVRARVLRAAEQTPGEWVLGCAFEDELARQAVQDLLLGTIGATAAARSF